MPAISVARAARDFTITARRPERLTLGNVVMPGLVPGIHVLGTTSKEDVDGRDKPGHDGEGPMKTTH